MQRRELWIGVYVGVVWNLGVAAVLNNPLESSTRTWLVVTGAANELLGVLMIASPELLPLLASLLRYLYRRLRRLVSWSTRQVRRLLHLPTTGYANLSANIQGTASIQAKVTRVPPSTLQHVIEWVKRHDEELLKHQEQLDSMPDQWKQDIDERAGKVEDLARALVRGLADRNLDLRLLGVGFVVLGIWLSTSGNLV